LKNGNRKNSILKSFNTNKYSIFDVLYFMYLGYYLIMNTFQQLLPQTDTYLYRASGQEAYNQF